jgi:2-polyprenyl-3-methyl-5-hydroxy-6-metoxy-1,4-benzoquinol methylase
MPFAETEHGKRVAVYEAAEVADAPPAEHRMRWSVDRLIELTGLDLNHAAILDLGCGLGQLCYYLRSRFPPADLHGIDDYVTRKHDPHFTYTGHDLSTRFPYPDRRFDVVFALEVLEHMLDTDFFLAEIKRVLRPGGWIVITTPNICGYGNRLRVPLGLYPYWLEYRQVIQHVRLYNRAALVSHLAEAGFQVTAAHGTHLLPSRLIENNRAAASVSNGLCRMFPAMSMGLMAIASRPKSA